MQCIGYFEFKEIITEDVDTCALKTWIINSDFIAMFLH